MKRLCIVHLASTDRGNDSCNKYLTCYCINC